MSKAHLVQHKRESMAVLDALLTKGMGLRLYCNRQDGDCHWILTGSWQAGERWTLVRRLRRLQESTNSRDPLLSRIHHPARMPRLRVLCPGGFNVRR